MVKNYKVRVPMIYIRTRGSKDKWSLLGANHHDVLQVINNGRHLIYSNEQTQESTEAGYEFKGLEEIVDDIGTTKYRIRMVPWTDAIKIYKRHDKSYRHFCRILKQHTSGRC